MLSINLQELFPVKYYRAYERRSKSISISVIYILDTNCKEKYRHGGSVKNILFYVALKKISYV
jgi:hypothetical protein